MVGAASKALIRDLSVAAERQLKYIYRYDELLVRDIEARGGSLRNTEKPDGASLKRG